MPTTSLSLLGHTVTIARSPASKPAILLVHGIGVSSEYYKPFIAALATDYDVHSIDLPGYGDSPKPNHPLTIQQLAAIVVAYGRYINKPFILVGQSMGCQIIAHAAKEAPDLFTHLIHIAPTVNISERTLALQGLRLMQDCFIEGIAANKIVLKNYLRMGLRRYVATAKMMVRDHIETTMESVFIPTLIVTGQKDRIAPRSWTSVLARNTPNAMVVTVSDAPHLVQLHKPAELARLTREFTGV